MKTAFTKVLWNSQEDRLRAPVRLMVQLSITLGCTFVAILAIGTLLSYGRHRALLARLDKHTFDQIGNIVVAPFAALAIYLSLKFGSRWIERRNFSIYGITVSPVWWRELWFGFALSAALMTLIFVAELLAGWIRIEGYFRVSQAGDLLSISLLYCVVKVVVVGICEELIFRGLVLRNFVEGLTGVGSMGERTSTLVALLLSAFLFGAVHLGNPNSGVASTVGIFVIGIFFGFGYLASGRLAIPIGLHMAWNFFQGVIYGFPVSGEKEPASVFLTRQSGGELFTGGSFGPEAGLISILAAVLGIVALVAYMRRPSQQAGSYSLSRAGVDV